MKTTTNGDSNPSKDLKWKKCPLTEDTAYLHETRPVRFCAGSESPLPRVGGDVVAAVEPGARAKVEGARQFALALPGLET